MNNLTSFIRNLSDKDNSYLLAIAKALKAGEDAKASSMKMDSSGKSQNCQSD